MHPFCKAESWAVSPMLSVSGRRIILWNKYWHNIYHQILELKADKMHLTKGVPICSPFTASNPYTVWIWLLWEDNIPQRRSEVQTLWSSMCRLVPHYRENCTQDFLLPLIRERLVYQHSWPLITPLGTAEGLASADEAWCPFSIPLFHCIFI